MTVHQPSSRLFELMDQVIILNKGPCLYQGPSSVLPAYPDERGYGVPPNDNPVDWAIEVSETVDLQTLGEEGFMRDFLGSEPPNCKDRDVEIHWHGIKRPSTPASSKRLFIEDSARVLVDRNQVTNDARPSIFDYHSGFLLHCNCLSRSLVARTQFHVAFFLVIVNVISLQIILLDFIDQRPLFVREFLTDHFRMGTYCVTKVVMESTSTFFQVLILTLATYWSLELTGMF